jgi:hypothetical protein
MLYCKYFLGVHYMYIDDFRGIDTPEDLEEFQDSQEYQQFENFQENEDLNCMYSSNNDDIPFECPFRQMMPFPPNFNGQGPHSGEQNPNMSQGFPSSAPPKFTPQKQTNQMNAAGGPSVKAIDPGAIRPCTYRFVYIWPKRGRGFWAWLTYVGRRSASGFRWNGFRWVYFGMDLRSIDHFQCY